jgi:glucosyl-3-phosphoglycerate phosphatase
MIVLVRHASTADTGVRFSGRLDPPLDEVGRRDAARLATEIVPTLETAVGSTGREVHVLSSPLRRARETATAVMRCLTEAGLRVPGPILDPRLRETDFGDVEGLTWADFEHGHPVLARAILDGHTDIDWPGGEAHAAFVRRLQAAWADVVARAMDTSSPVVVVSHGGPLRVILDDLAPDASANRAVMPPAAWVAVDPATLGDRHASGVPTAATPVPR